MDFVEHLKASIDIVKVIGEYVRLKRAGPRWMGLCPFHTEKTGSFSVHATHQFYYCFGCQAKGDAIKFVMEIERLSFYEALKLLAERNGIPLPKRSEYSDPETKQRAGIFEMHELAARMFRNALASGAGADARAYLAKRAVAAGQIEEFGLGFADRSGQFLVRRFEQEGFNAEQMETSGLVLKRQEGPGFFDRFRGRLMFPIQNESGKIIAFAGRALAAGEEPKYLNSPETPIYHKSTVLYNLHRAKEGIRKRDRAVLVEGYMDVIGVYSAGVHEVVASCGTALTNAQVRALKRHSANLVVNFDPDAAGANAAERSIQILLEEDIRIRILELEQGLDPDEYVKQRGAAAYQEKLAAAGSYFHWLADRARARRGATVEGQMAALKELLPSIHRMSDKLERAAVAEDVAHYLGVERGIVLEQFRKAALDRRERTPGAEARLSVPAMEKILLNAILASPAIRPEILPRLQAMGAAQRFVTRGIFQILFLLQESGQNIGFSEIDARLEEPDRQLLLTAVLADEMTEGADFREQAEACLKKLEASEREGRRTEVRARLKEAERAGNFAEALRLAEELNRLDSAGAKRTDSGAPR
ncbi:MAG: DNA primase [Bryobacterales bacterium]|nr:DNA primase [Bryobacterales bacterium]